jgi:site-specific DNA recombinase
MKAAIYCRVSGDSQERDGTSLSTQTEAALVHCQDRGYHVVRKFVGVESGLILDRPMLNELREMVRQKEIDVIVVYSTDRYYRNPDHEVIMLDELERHGVILEAVTERIDRTPEGKLVNYVRGYSSLQEALKIKERTTRGKKEHLKRGLLPQGTGIGLYGYKWDKELKKRVIIENESETVRNIFSTAISGKGYFSIARDLNSRNIPTKSGSKWFPLTIKRILTCTSYYGATYFGMTSKPNNNTRILKPKEEWILLPDVTPPIITKETFDKAQEALKLPKGNHGGKALHDYLLTGHIRCGICGNPLVGSCLNKRWRYYSCVGARYTSTRPRVCSARYHRADKLEEQVWNKVKGILQKPQVYQEMLEELEGYKNRESDGKRFQKEIAKLKRKLANFGYQEKRLMSLFRYEEISENQILDEVNRLKKEREEVQEILSHSEQSLAETNSLHKVEIELKKVSLETPEEIENYNFPQKRHALNAFKIAVTVYPKGHSEKDRVDCFIPIKRLFDLVTTEQTSASPRGCSCRSQPV